MRIVEFKDGSSVEVYVEEVAGSDNNWQVTAELVKMNAVTELARFKPQEGYVVTSEDFNILSELLGHLFSILTTEGLIEATGVYREQ